MEEFLQVDSVTAQKTELVANPTYYGGRPILNSVLFRFYPDVESLFAAYEKGEIKLMEKGEYIDAIIELLTSLDEEIVIHRLTGDRDSEIFHAPDWAADKVNIINEIQIMYQGSI